MNSGRVKLGRSNSGSEAADWGDGCKAGGDRLIAGQERLRDSRSFLRRAGEGVASGAGALGRLMQGEGTLGRFSPGEVPLKKSVMLPCLIINPANLET